MHRARQQSSVAAEWAFEIINKSQKFFDAIGGTQFQCYLKDKCDGEKAYHHGATLVSGLQKSISGHTPKPTLKQCTCVYLCTRY